MSITVYKEFVRELNVNPATRYTIYNESGTVSELTEKEAEFLYKELGILLEIKDNIDKTT